MSDNLNTYYLIVDEEIHSVYQYTCYCDQRTNPNEFVDTVRYHHYLALLPADILEKHHLHIKDANPCIPCKMFAATTVAVSACTPFSDIFLGRGIDECHEGYSKSTYIMACVIHAFWIDGSSLAIIPNRRQVTETLVDMYRHFIYVSTNYQATGKIRRYYPADLGKKVPSAKSLLLEKVDDELQPFVQMLGSLLGNGTLCKKKGIDVKVARVKKQMVKQLNGEVESISMDAHLEKLAKLAKHIKYRDMGTSAKS